MFVCSVLKSGQNFFNLSAQLPKSIRIFELFNFCKLFCVIDDLWVILKWEYFILNYEHIEVMNDNNELSVSILFYFGK